MIPFWKKTGKHSKPQSTQKRRQKAKPAVPRTAQQSIPMQRMFEDGTDRKSTRLNSSHSSQSRMPSSA